MSAKTKMTRREVRVLLKLMLWMVSYGAWAMFVLCLAMKGFPTLAHWMRQSEDVRSWIAESGIPPGLVVTATVMVWFAPACLLIWAPALFIRKKMQMTMG